MPSNPVAFQASVVMPGASGYALPIASFSPVLTTPYEPFADYHWVFGTDNTTFTDLVQGAQLQRNFQCTVTGGSGYEAQGTFTLSNGGSGVWFSTAGVITSAYVTSLGSVVTSAPTATISTATGTGGAITVAVASAPTQNALSITTTGGSGNAAGLLTPITDAATDTVCAVVKITTGSNMMVFGTLNNTGGYVGYGASIYQASSLSYSLNTRTGSAVVLGGPTGVANGNYVFLAMSHKSDGTRAAYVGGPTPLIPTLANQVKTLPSGFAALKHGIGDCYYPTFATQVEVCEYFHLPRFCDATDLAALYARSKTRMASRGITVF